jgi:hypothetical protein
MSAEGNRTNLQIWHDNYNRQRDVDAEIGRIVRDPTDEEFLYLGRAEWNARDILVRLIELAERNVDG